ncbi:MAG: aminotransferase class I/II-fold pyridoxal phosphate-dependent enzyme, partial [Symploca sp. SIO2D2]|nr:aminotransferase class I/II-fold pyridoxal phosphate-dependent enzyme [Symploca sp. SIO2D2]
DRVRDSYNVNRLSQAAGVAALRDQSYLKAIVGKVKATRDYYRSEFEDMGWFAYPSASNFIFVEPRNSKGESGAEIAEELFLYLKANKILVRYFPGHALTESFLRISVGDENQMLVLSETIRKWLKNG